MAQTKVSFRTLLRYALLHPWHVVLAAGSAVFGVANWDLGYFLKIFVFCEVVLMCIVLLAPAFRRYVQESEDKKAKEVADFEQIKVLSSLMESHRQTYGRLALQIEQTKARLTKLGIAFSMEECQHLLSMYLELAKQYSLSACSSRSYADLETRLTYLEEQKKKAYPGEREILEERYALLRERIKLLKESNSSNGRNWERLNYLEDLIDYKIDQITLSPAFSYSVSCRVAMGDDLSIAQETMAEMEEFAHIQELDSNH